MSIKVKCPGCTKTLTVPDAARGKAVKCPSCETRVSVPGDDEPAAKPAAGKPKKSGKKAAPIDDESGLASLDLRKVADQGANVCPKCGCDLDQGKENEEDIITECPQCGWDIEEGGMGAKARKRALKGPDPDKFYPGLWKNSWNFVGVNLMLVIRTFLYVLLASVILWISVLGYLYFSMKPPRYMFFAPLAFVAAMVIPGWLWFLDTEIIKLTLERRDRFKRLNFDFFQSGALGVKFVVWNFVFAGPLLLIPAIVGWALSAFAGMPWWITPLILAFCYIPIIGLWPVVLTHMTMPIQSPAWMFWKVIPMGLRCFKPLFWWLFLFCVTSFPIVLIMGLTLLFTGGAVVEFAEIRETEAEINRIEAYVASVGSAKKKPADLRDPLSVTNFAQLEEIKIVSWHKQAEDEIHVFEAMFDYDAKEGGRKTYRSEARGKLDKILVASGQVAANTPIAAVTQTPITLSHYIALAATAFAWLVSLVILAITSLFNMRTNGWFSYYFREQLDLQVLIKEYKYVATISRDPEKKFKTTGDVAAEGAVAVVIFMIMGVIFGLLYGAMTDFGVVNGLVMGLYVGAGIAGFAAFIGLIIAAYGVSPVWGLLVFPGGCFCIIPAIFFVVQEWDEAKPFFFQWLFSTLTQFLLTPIMLIMGIGPWAGFMEGVREGQNQQGPIDPAVMPKGAGAVDPANAGPAGAGAAGAGPAGAGGAANPGPAGAAGAGAVPAGGAAAGTAKPGG